MRSELAVLQSIPCALEPAFRSTLLSCPCHRALLCRLRWPISGALEDDMKSTNFLLISFDQRPWPIQPCGIVGCGSILLIQSFLASVGQMCAKVASCRRGRADPGETWGDPRHVPCFQEERQAAHCRDCRRSNCLFQASASVILCSGSTLFKVELGPDDTLFVAQRVVSNCVYNMFSLPSGGPCSGLRRCWLVTSVSAAWAVFAYERRTASYGRNAVAPMG